MRRPIESLLTWQARYGDVFTIRPYAFGRIVVQMKHAGTIETGIFDAKVE